MARPPRVVDAGERASPSCGSTPEVCVLVMEDPHELVHVPLLMAAAPRRDFLGGDGLPIAHRGAGLFGETVWASADGASIGIMPLMPSSSSYARLRA